jgi:hypothetical protein
MKTLVSFTAGLLISAPICSSIWCSPVMAQCVESPTGLVSWWRGEGNATDAVWYNDGTLKNGTTFKTGKVSRAFSFDGIDDVVQVPDSDSWTFGSQDFSIDLWVNFSQINGRDPFIGHDDGGGELKKWIFWYDESGHTTPGGPALRFHLNGGPSGPIDTIYYSWSPVKGRWYHVAVTRNASTYALYINGVQVAISTNQTDAVEDASAPLTIGEAEGYAFNGRIDEIDIFNRALAAEEIRDIFMAGSSGKCIPQSPPLSGFVQGMVPNSGKVVCQNLTTSQSVTITVPKGVRSWNCEDAGLTVNVGDSIKINTNWAGPAQ